MISLFKKQNKKSYLFTGKVQDDVPINLHRILGQTILHPKRPHRGGDETGTGTGARTHGQVPVKEPDLVPSQVSEQTDTGTGIGTGTAGTGTGGGTGATGLTVENSNRE
jgi:hypothetical protein